MTQVIRTHANNIEYVPMALVLLGLIEMLGAPGLAVHVLGILLFAGRLFHAQGLITSSKVSVGRAVGAGSTWLVITLACLYALYLFAVGGRA